MLTPLFSQFHSARSRESPRNSPITSTARSSWTSPIRVQLDGFVAGDDADAKKQVTHLLDEIGFRTIDVGPLAMARHLESMAFLNIALNAKNGWSWQTGWKLVGPTT
jgi:predicted dinucleotide-binding enzyme